MSLSSSGGSDDEVARKLNGCARSLRFAKMRSTGVRAGGVRALLAHAAALEGVRCSNYDVLQVGRCGYIQIAVFKPCILDDLIHTNINFDVQMPSILREKTSYLMCFRLSPST